MILYHGTDSKFNKFSKSKIGSNTNVTSVGFFFTDNYNTAKSYGDTVLKCDVDLGAYIECDFDGNSTYYFGEEKWYTPNMLAERIDELNKDIANYGYSIGNMSREEAEEYMDYLGQDGGYGHLYDDKIDSIICKNIKDNMDFGGELSNNYIVFDENRIKVLGNVNERLEDIGKCFITKSAYDIVNLLKNKPKEYRILYDNRIKMYMIGDANDITHWDMIQNAYKNALYYDQEDFIEELGGTLDNYVDIGQSGFWDGDTEEENIEPYLWYIVFSPNEDWTLGTDGYDKRYDYPFGHVFTRGCDLDDISLWEALGVPQETEKLNESEETNLNAAFWKWFGNSKLIKNGKPLVFYHRTNAVFDTFDKDFGSPLLADGFYFSDKPLSEWYGKNIMEVYLKMEKPYIIEDMQNIDDVAKFVEEFNLLSEDIKATLQNYSNEFRSNKDRAFDGKAALRRVIKWHLNDQTKYVTERLQKKNYDGLIIKNSDGQDDIKYDEYIVFKPEQIKSIDNKGTWSIKSSNIYENLNKLLEEYL